MVLSRILFRTRGELQALAAGPGQKQVVIRPVTNRSFVLILRFNEAGKEYGLCSGAGETSFEKFENLADCVKIALTFSKDKRIFFDKPIGCEPIPKRLR